MTALASPAPVRPRRQERFPRVPLYTGLALVAFAIAATIFGRATDIGTVRTPVTTPLEIRDVRFVTQEDDTIAVLDGSSGALIETIPTDKDGFIRGSLRGLSRDRKLRGIAYDEPYRIILWDDGRLTLSDVATGMRVQLDPFGPANSGAYARFLPHRSATR